MKTVFLTISNGHAVRDFLVHRTLRLMLEEMPEHLFHILSPSYNVSSFRNLCNYERVTTGRMEIHVGFGKTAKLVAGRKRIIKCQILHKLLLRLEAMRTQTPDYLLKEFDLMKPCFVILTHPMTIHDYFVWMEAYRRGIPSLGIVKSWDNVLKGFYSKPDFLSVWNKVNRDEAVNLQGYRAGAVTINGSLPYDPYFTGELSVSREEFLASLDLNPAFPVITLATAGVFNRGFLERDETHLVDDILSMTHQSSIMKHTQLIIRLHPISRIESFLQYAELPGVRISHGAYMPAIGWYSSQKNLHEQVGILQHSDVIVTPGSSWTIEAAIFDTPVVVPVYSNLQPDHARAQFDEFTLLRHFRPILESGLAPITRSLEETQKEIESALSEPRRLESKRRELVSRFATFTDGQTAERVAKWCSKLVLGIR